MIKNYTTTISAEKTLMEIEKLLVDFGSKGIYKEYEGSNISSIMFYMVHDGKKIPFKIPLRLNNMRNLISKLVKNGKLPQRFNSEPLRTEQGLRVGLRIIKDWIHSQLSLLEAEFCEPLELLLPYAFNPVNDKTMYQQILEKKKDFLALEDLSE